LARVSRRDGTIRGMDPSSPDAWTLLVAGCALLCLALATKRAHDSIES